MMQTLTRLKGVLSVGLVLCLTGCASDTGLVAGVDHFNEFKNDIQVSDTQTKTLEEALDYFDMHGVSVITLENGIISGLAFHGIENTLTNSLTDQNTVYQAASLSKIVAGLAMAKAERTGLVDIDADVVEHLLAHQGDNVHGWYTREFLTTTKKRWAEAITIRRLLQNSGGTNRPKTGTACDADDTSIKNFLGTFTTLCIDCVNVTSEPGTKFKYSSGGYVVAEAMFEEASGRSARKYLNDEILALYGLNNSTFKNAGTGIANLATACDSPITPTGLCSCPHEIAKVKFPGGLLANSMDYARLLMLLMNDGAEPTGQLIIPRSDVRAVILPSHHKDSSLNYCTNKRTCPSGEECIAAQCMTPLGKGSNWYGMGVHMAPQLGADGYPRELYHEGGQDGFSSYFNIDRTLRNGVLIFINGSGKSDRKALLNDIIDSFKRHYR